MKQTFIWHKTGLGELDTIAFANEGRPSKFNVQPFSFCTAVIVLRQKEKAFQREKNVKAFLWEISHISVICTVQKYV